MNSTDIIVTPESDKKRVDSVIAALTEHSRTSAALFCERGQVRINCLVVTKSAVVKTGDIITLTLPDEPALTGTEPLDIALDIVFEDKHVLVVNKPRGLVVHPAHGHEQDTLVNALLFHCKGANKLSGIGGELRPGIVHRIDKDTSGLLVIAKNDHSHRFLAEQLATHGVTREYQAMVQGTLKQAGTVRTQIARDVNNRKRMAVVRTGGRESVTHFEPVETHSYRNATHLRLRLETGRTHQIRVHMAFISHPVLGDAVYGSGKPTWLAGQCLHAGKLGFVHPGTGEYLEFSAPLPDYFVKLQKQLLLPE